MKTRICQVCNQTKEIIEFKRIRDGHYRHKCKDCWYKLKGENDAQRFAKRKQSNDPYISRLNQKRRDWYASAPPEKWILKESKKNDKRKGFKNDLTIEFIAALIKNPCAYCGETNLRMTLDRIDNALGHTQENVIQACIRCNLIRKDMPYQAWIELTPTLCLIRQKNLFGDWIGRKNLIKK